MKQNRKLKFSLFVLVPLICILAFFLIQRNISGQDQLSSTSQASGKNSKRQVASPLFISESTNVRAKKYLENPKPKDKIEKTTLKYLNAYMDDPAFSLFFRLTLEFFGETPGSIPAAKFVAMSLLFDSSADNFTVMSSAKKQMQKDSAALMKVLNAKKDKIPDNPFFKSRMLNLVNNLEVTPKEKNSFFAHTLRKPVETSANGSLTDRSLDFEVALILAKQNSERMNPVVAAAIKSAYLKSTTEAQKTAIKDRVLTYYPEATLIF